MAREFPQYSYAPSSSCCLGFPALRRNPQSKEAWAGWCCDSTGAVIPGAEVKLTGPTGAARTTQSDAEGKFLFPLLPPRNVQRESTEAGIQSRSGKRR